MRLSGGRGTLRRPLHSLPAALEARRREPHAECGRGGSSGPPSATAAPLSEYVGEWARQRRPSVREPTSACMTFTPSMWSCTHKCRRCAGNDSPATEACQASLKCWRPMGGMHSRKTCGAGPATLSCFGGGIRRFPPTCALASTQLLSVRSASTRCLLLLWARSADGGALPCLLCDVDVSMHGVEPPDTDKSRPGNMRRAGAHESS
mmetsp:Transcript_72330/g.182986  ORF Transcript_72330/g.182986 Transcript_72330/m.182986 type:complete len:206 (+) Transcript_72330:306-923(+)